MVVFALLISLLRKFCRPAKFQWHIRIAMLSVLFFCCARLFVRSLARMLFRSYPRVFARLFFCYFGYACISLLFVQGCSFGAFALCYVCRYYLIVTTLRVHPAETRLTVYRRPYMFREHKMMYSKQFCDRLVGPCLKIIFRKYHVPALRNKKVIRVRATGSMDRKFGNHEFF